MVNNLLKFINTIYFYLVEQEIHKDKNDPYGGRKKNYGKHKDTEKEKKEINKAINDSRKEYDHMSEAR